MTKEEYRDEAFKEFLKERMVDANDVALLLKVYYNNGFNAACDYYREHILELKDNG